MSKSDLLYGPRHVRGKRGGTLSKEREKRTFDFGGEHT